MYLKLLSPFYTGFRIAPGNRTNLPGSYVNFWDNLKLSSHSINVRASNSQPLESSVTLRNKQVSPSQPELYFSFHYRHATETKDNILYASIDRDTLPLPVEIMTIKIVDPTNYIDKKLDSLLQRKLENSQDSALLSNLATGNEQNEAKRQTLEKLLKCKTLVADSDALEIRIYDHDIGILTVPITVKCPQDFHSDCALFLEILRDTGIEFAAALIQEIYQDYLASILNDLVLKSVEHFGSDEVIQHLAVDPAEQILWITRTLIFESEDRCSNGHARRASNTGHWMDSYIVEWLKDTGIPDSSEDAVDSHRGIYSLQELLTKENSYSMSWLNYLFREGVTSQEQEDAFEAMHLAQYYYAALEKLNNGLHKIIGTAFSPIAEQDIRSLNYSLKQISNRTNMLIAEYQEIQKYLKRRKQKILGKIMAGWFFQDIISNAEKKLSICLQRINSLNQISSHRNTFLTDTILLIIGMLSIIDLSIALSEYGRTLNTDATLGIRSESTRILNFYASVASDIMLLLCLLFIGSFVGVYLILRNKTLL